MVIMGAPAAVEGLLTLVFSQTVEQEPQIRVTQAVEVLASALSTQVVVAEVLVVLEQMHRVLILEAMVALALRLL
jgi:hypothetical protein